MRTILIIIIVALLAGCSTKKQVVKTHTTTTIERQLDTVIEIPSKQAEFYPEQKDTVIEVLTDKETGIIARIQFTSTPPTPKAKPLFIKKLLVDVPPEEINLKVDEVTTTETTTKTKEITGTPWYVKGALLIGLLAVVLLIIAVFIIKNILNGFIS